MWYNESNKCGVAAMLKHPATDNRKVVSAMDNTVPHRAPRRKLRIFDGSKSTKANNRLNSDLPGPRGGNTVIYGMEDPRDGSVFYVGLTNNLYLRFKQHMGMSGDNTSKQTRIQAILDANMLPIMRTLEVVDPYIEPREREIAWIETYVARGGALLNDEINKELDLEGD